MSARKDYDKLRKKYKALPNWAWLEENFKVKDETPVLDTIRVAIGDKTDGICHSIIEPLIGRNDNFCCWFEKKMISKDDYSELFGMYKKFQSILWMSNEISLGPKEKLYVEFIVKTKKIWDKHASGLSKLCGKVSKGWETYKKKEVETYYHR
jgi:hypothetical protein